MFSLFALLRILKSILFIDNNDINKMKRRVTTFQLYKAMIKD